MLICAHAVVLRSSGNLATLKAVLLSSIKNDILKEAQKRFKTGKSQASKASDLSIDRIGAAAQRERQFHSCIFDELLTLTT